MYIQMCLLQKVCEIWNLFFNKERENGKDMNIS